MNPQPGPREKPNHSQMTKTKPAVHPKTPDRTVSSPGHALQLVAPLSHRARIGEDVNIPCSFTVNNTPINQKFLAISWFFQGKEILSVQNAKVRSRDPRVSYTGRREHGTANLSISDIAVMDGGIYKCSILYTPKKEEKEIRLDIQATPQINITDRVVVTNKKSSLHGVISGFYPVDIDIKWLQDGEMLDNVIMEIPQRDPDGTYSVRSSVTITPTEEDRERILSCRVQHESLTAPLQEDFRLVYGEIPSVHITSQAFKLNVEQSLVCSVSKFYPESLTVNWFLNDTLLENAKTRRISSSAVASVYQFIAKEQSWGMELRCVVEHGTLTTPHVERLLVQETGSVIIMDQNQDGTFNATSTCESLRGVIQENEPYTVQAVVEHDKLKHPSVREWRSDDKDNKAARCDDPDT
ncbi:PREDICTED: signal-regulatory protein beta-1-like [Nanorana parkeri]|uniref:signal-regulatory protein beta-1-like n=1 Tax=Nanorana parkeri TaxID=125878 RepID=UPI0008548530|nr:PREDICTED: signal-regulatory protein beta-1-like [Nanorana parkeri]